MRKVLSILFLSLVSINLVSAATFLNIYIDPSGNSLFLGETSETSLNLPEGIRIENGEILGSTHR